MGPDFFFKIFCMNNYLGVYTVKHRNNGHQNNGMLRNNGKNADDGAFYVVNNGKIHASE